MSAWANPRHTLGDSGRWWERRKCDSDWQDDEKKMRLEIKDLFLKRKPDNEYSKCS